MHKRGPLVHTLTPEGQLHVLEVDRTPKHVHGTTVDLRRNPERLGEARGLPELPPFELATIGWSSSFGVFPGFLKPAGAQACLIHMSSAPAAALHGISKQLSKFFLRVA